MNTTHQHDLPHLKKAMRGHLRQTRLKYCEQHRARLTEEFDDLASHAADLMTLFRTLHSADRPDTPVTIASFKAKGSEINPTMLEKALAGMGHQLAWPRVQHDGIRFYAADGSPPFLTGSYGLQEPHPKATELAPQLILVPLVAFDAKGHRLGQGGGYYDRALARRSAQVLAVGLAFDCQEVEQVPHEDHDVPLTAVLTPKGLRRF